MGWGQTTIASDGLNNSSSLFTLVNGAYYSGNSASNENPASSPFAAEGTYSRGGTMTTATLTGNSDINTSGYTNISLTSRLASFSLNGATNGADAGDVVTIEISSNGGTTWFNTLQVKGNSNACWSFSGGTGIATTSYDGDNSPVIFAPSGGGIRTTDGYSTLTITSLPAITNLRVRITLLNDNANERWVFDDFKITGTAISTGTNTIAAGSGAEPASISSLLNDQMDVSINFDIDITDDGATPATDALATKITQMVFEPGTGNDVSDWTKVIAGADLTDGTNTQSGTINALNITFPGINPTTLGLIADDATKNYILKVWLKTDFGTENTTADGKNLVFRIQNSNITVDNTGSGFATGQDQNSGSGNNALDVIATQMDFVQNATNIGINANMSPAVTISANDENGNRDLNYTSNIDITSTGTLLVSPVAVAATAGLATFSAINHTAPGTGLVLTASDGTLTDINSVAFDVTLQSNTSDYFRSNVVSGNWGTAGSWESSSDNMSWITATLAPTSAANNITIRNGHTISITSAVTIDQVVVESGGTLTISGAVTVNNGTGDDILVQNGGKVIYTSSAWSYSSGATIRVSTGGTVSIESSGITGAATGVNSNNHIYDDGSILQWNLPGGTPSSSGITFFPNVDATTIPIFRFAAATGGSNYGSGGFLTFNGVVQFADGINITFTGGGTKTFRNGIIGLGTNSIAFSSTQNWLISGTFATIGTTGTSLTLNNPNLTISSPTATLIGSTILSSSFIVTGSLTCGSGASITFGTNLLSGAGVFNLSSGGTIKTGHASGLDGTITTTTKTFASGAIYEYNGIVAQTTGALLPSTISGGLLISNTSTGVTLTNDVTLTGTDHSIANGSTLIIPVGKSLNNNGTITNAGTLTINGTIKGTGTIAGDLTNNAKVAPGNSAGTVTVTGNYSASPASTHDFELFSLSSYDQMNIGGTLTLVTSGMTGSTLTVTLQNAYVPTNGDSWDLITTGGITGTFKNVNLPSGYSWSLTYTGNVVKLLFLGPLPVELSYFNAIKRNKTVDLQWQTLSESNCDYFGVERSNDGNSYTELTQMRGNGTTQATNDYLYTDAQPFAGINYYRLRQVDFDGRSEYSPTRNVVMGTGNDVKLSPTITRNSIELSFATALNNDSEIYIAEISTGRILYAGMVQADSYGKTIDVSNLQAGTYLLKFSNGVEVVTKMFVVVR